MAVLNEHAEDMDADRIYANVLQILADFQKKELPPLEGLTVLVYVYENIVYNLLRLSAPGKFESNRDGLLPPLESLYRRIKEMQPQASIILPAGVQES